MRIPGFVVLVLAVVLSSVLTRGQVKRTDPDIVPLDAGGLATLLAGARGEPVLIDFWATWCVPCIEEFPDILRVKEMYGQRGLLVVFISIDRPRDAGTAVTRFLRKHGVHFTTYIKKAGNDEAFINAVDPDWSGALPATFVYDAGGTLKEKLIGQQSFDILSKTITPFLHR